MYESARKDEIKRGQMFWRDWSQMLRLQVEWGSTFIVSYHTTRKRVSLKTPRDIHIYAAWLWTMTFQAPRKPPQMVLSHSNCTRDIFMHAFKEQKEVPLKMPDPFAPMLILLVLVARWLLHSVQVEPS